MIKGPRAKIAEIVVNTLPRPRSRHDIHKDIQYYRIRNHLVDLLVTRSKQFALEAPDDYDPLHPSMVRPRLDEKLPVEESTEAESPRGGQPPCGERMKPKSKPKTNAHG
jgi:nitrate/nitrite transport system ATP-binding protein